MHTRTIVRRAARTPQLTRGPRGNKALSSFWRLVSAALVIAYMAGGLFSGYLFYETVRTLVAAIPLATGPDTSSAPIVSRSNPIPSNPENGGSSAPNAPAAAVQPQMQWPFTQQQRVNFLLMGVDLRPGETGPTRTDTMIIVSVDPATRSVGMLSIPRDLWVPIPGYGEDRINTAYFTGDARKYPGGGPALAEKTIQYNFGVPINYYIAINFVGFRKLVDALGGLTIDVPRDINDSAYPDDTYGVRQLFIAKGMHHFNGDEALAYARTRHESSDFGRMRRQQQVLKAIKDQALSLDVFTKIPALWAAKEDAIRTDLSLDKIVALVQLAKDIKTDNINTGVIDESMALGITTPGGAMVLWPEREKIRKVIEQVFATPEGVPMQPPAQAQPQPTPVENSEQYKKLAAEGARIEISNGTAIDQLELRVAAWLKSQGFNIVLADSADTRNYDQSLVVETSNRPYARGLLLTIFGVTQNVRQNPNSKSDIDLRIIIGKDFDEKQIPDSR
jgi:LCP family protein required for cell wall assembly